MLPANPVAVGNTTQMSYRGALAARFSMVQVAVWLVVAKVANTTLLPEAAATV